MKARLAFWFGVTIASILLAVSAFSQQRGPRVALLIGNASYPDASTPLSTTIRDARALADEFRRSDFEVDLKENLGKEDMQRAIDAFMAKIRTGTGVVFAIDTVTKPSHSGSNGVTFTRTPVRA